MDHLTIKPKPNNISTDVFYTGLYRYSRLLIVQYWLVRVEMTQPEWETFSTLSLLDSYVNYKGYDSFAFII